MLVIAFLATWREMGWVAATVFTALALVILAMAVVALIAYLHPEAREKRAIRRRRTARVNAMRLLRSTAERVCFRDARGLSK